MTGWTSSASGFRVTSTAAQSAPGGGSRDAFVARIGPFADLSIVINDNDPVLQGNALTYSVTVTNNGPDTATGVVLSVSLPATTDAPYVSDDSGCVHSNGTVTCNLPDMTSGSTNTVQIDVTLNTASQVSATASVSANEADYTANNSDTEFSQAGQPDSGTSNDSQNTTNPNDLTGPFILITDGKLVQSGGGGGALSLFALVFACLWYLIRLVIPANKFA